MKSLYNNEVSVLIVRSLPVIDDPKELHTILVFSLRHLWGDLESHSCDLKVRKHCTTTNETDASPLQPETLLAVQCRSESVSAVRAALTFVTPPSYLNDTLYRFDVLDVQNDESNTFMEKSL